jgi:hypothetical protein
MKRNFTLVLFVLLFTASTLPITIVAQFNPGLPAAFGIDGDVISGQSQNISGNSPQGSFDWFKKIGSGANVGIGVIDTSGTLPYATQIAAGQNVTFSRGMAFNRYSAQNGYLLLDARYARDKFGLANSGGQNDLTTYTSGAKNGDDPTSWTTTPGGATVGDKGDIIDTYIHMRRNGTVINNTNPSALILAMGVSTIGNTGNRYVDFELFRTRVNYNPTTGIFSNSGPATTGGHSAWQFNPNGTVKEIGDMSVSFTYSTAGVEEISVYIWVSQFDYNNTAPAKFSFVPNNFHGSTYGYAKITALIPVGFQSWGSASTGNTNAPAWGTTSKASGSSSNNYVSANYAAYDFGEVAIDLTSLGIDPALSVGMNPCSPPFTRVMAKTRSSSTFESALQDFTGPYEFLDAPQVPAQIANPGVLKCNVTTTTLSPAIIISGAVYQWTTTTGNIVSDPNATTITVNTQGKYFLTAAIVAGCPTNIDSTTVIADYYKPVASASVTGLLDPANSLSTVNLIGGNVAASNYLTPFGNSAGLTWKWTGPDGYTANIKNPTTNIAGAYTLELTETRNGCKDYAVINIVAAALLPVKYLSFDAVAANKAVLLKWTITQEINNSHFEIERSFDNTTFTTIGLVLDGTTINGTEKNYLYEDNAPELLEKVIVYYRLKQFDIDGKMSSSKVIAVRLQASKDIVMQVSPNPFAENLYVRFTAIEKGTAEIRLINASGQIVLTRQSFISKGYNNIQLQGLSKFTNGLYVAQLLMNGVIIDNQKIIKN